MIELTVALPIWNSEKIAWLCIESLCEQKNVDFEWELLIAEEAKNGFGIERVKPYLERLKSAGCTSVKYTELDYKIPLPQKWRLLAQQAAETSKAFVFCAADDYSEPNKLKTAYEAIKLGYDWAQYQKMLMFDIKSRRHIYYDCESINRKVGAIMACKTSAARRLPESSIPKGVDHWLFDKIHPEFIFTDKSDNWQKGFGTDGYNNISLDRKKHYFKTELPFKATELNIKNVVSKEVYEKLINL
jgi:glycosyltransferase involved in cell wall biosynthesis